MLSFSAALLFDLGLAIVLIAGVARLLHGQGRAALLSYLAYLLAWSALVVYMLVFLYAPHLLPEGAQRGYMLLNSVFVVPLNGLVACFFVDFVWRWLDKPMPRWLRFGLPAPFLVILFLYAREMLGRLSTDAPSGSFVLSPPVSLGLMFACLLGASLHVALAGRRMPDREEGRRMRLFAVATGAGLSIALLFAIGADSFLGPEWHNATTSMFFASANLGGWIHVRRSFEPRARAVGTGLAAADLSRLEERYGISPREREVISLMILGKSNREIAAALFISPETVKKHVYNSYRKIGVKNRVQLVNALLDA
jgi:DNA-binding CsgD family transcriptional regulator